MTNPGNVFKVLWELAEKDLAGDGGDGSMTVRYHRVLGKNDIEFGCYGPNRGVDGRACPIIEIWRSDDLPDPQWTPDLETRPLQDACDLSHEHGHFLSDRNKKRTAPYEAANEVLRLHMEQGARGVTAEERALILDEEERAWDYARETLTTLGVDDWEYFEERRAKALDSYRTA
jgi:hypothetical protein